MPALDDLYNFACFGNGVRPHVIDRRELADAKGYDGDAGELFVTIEHTCQGLFEHLAVVHFWATHDLAVHFDVSFEDRFEPSQAHGTTLVTQHVGAHVGVRGMDTDVERRQAFRDHPLKVGFGKTSQRGEVAIEKRESVVIVLEVQRAAHALGQLVNKTKIAVVVARTDPVKQSRIDVDTERLTGSFLDFDGHGETATIDFEFEFGLVHQALPLNHIAWILAIERHHGVTNSHTGDICRGTFFEVNHDRRTHRAFSLGGARQCTPCHRLRRRLPQC